MAHSVWCFAGGSSTGTWQWRPWGWGPWHRARSQRSDTTCRCFCWGCLLAQRFVHFPKHWEGYSSLWQDTQKLQGGVSLVDIQRKTWCQGEYRLYGMVYSLKEVWVGMPGQSVYTCYWDDLTTSESERGLQSWKIWCAEVSVHKY